MEQGIIKSLRIMTRTVSELYEKFGTDAYTDERQFENTTLKELESQGKVQIDEFGIVSLTTKFRKGLLPKEGIVKSNLVVPDKGTTYKGDELGKTCQRSGAYDFLQHPSRIGNSLYYREQ